MKDAVRFPGPYPSPGGARCCIDGEQKPSIQGTGAGDYFLMAWGLTEGLYPYFGCTHLSPDTESPGTEYCMYRWHVADPVRFSKSLRFAIEHTGWISADETESGKEVQKGYDWTGEGQAFFMPASDRPVLEVDFEVVKEEYRGLAVRMTHAEDYGIYRILLDGQEMPRPEGEPAAPGIRVFDFFSRELKVEDLYLGSFQLPAGKHTLRFEGLGRNPLSKGDFLGIDSVRLRQRWDRKRKLLT